jgi:hypothetical protein
MKPYHTLVFIMVLRVSQPSTQVVKINNVAEDGTEHHEKHECVMGLHILH